MSRIAISLENVITEKPDFWADFMKCARLEGHHIIVIGELWPNSINNKLDYNGLFHNLHYDKAISLIQYLKRLGEPVVYSDAYNGWAVKDKKAWSKGKADICSALSISLMIEKNPIFAPAFDFIPTRLLLVGLPRVMENLISLTDVLVEENEWFDDYESEFTVS